MALQFELTLRELAPVWPQELLPEIREHNRRNPTSLVVLDDDPTGTQTVHGVPVVTRWDQPTIVAEFESGTPLFYILTNSRAMGQEQAVRLAEEIGANLIEASGKTGRAFEVISRSDSTLRGHFPAEVDALKNALDAEDAVTVIIPFFEEGGRYTLNDTHYVREGDVLVAASETPFAGDAVFGYSRSNLREWVEEKTGGRTPAAAVASVSIGDIRKGGPARVADVLGKCACGGVCIVNAADYRDLEVVTMGLLRAGQQDNRFIYRTAASFVRSRAGLGPRALLTADELIDSVDTGGLIVVGSHVPKSSEQLANLLENTDSMGIELDVERVLAGSKEVEKSRIADSAASALEAGRDVVIYTSRRLITGASRAESLKIAERISQTLVEIVASLSVRPRYILAKGGITSSDVATKALRLIRADVLGQILPGVPVWRCGAESKFPQMPYIVFPGNVGPNDAITKVVQALKKVENH